MECVVRSPPQHLHQTLGPTAPRDLPRRLDHRRPKIRATQIIEELEPHRRGLYCGSIGAIGSVSEPLHASSGQEKKLLHTATFNLAIRTMQMIGKILTIHAGAGIVAYSDPQAEYEETLHKARAMFAAINWRP